MAELAKAAAQGGKAVGAPHEIKRCVGELRNISLWIFLIITYFVLRQAVFEAA